MGDSRTGQIGLGVPIHVVTEPVFDTERAPIPLRFMAESIARETCTRWWTVKEMSVQVSEETVTISQPQFLSSTIDRALYETIIAKQKISWVEQLLSTCILRICTFLSRPLKNDDIK